MAHDQRNNLSVNTVNDNSLKATIYKFTNALTPTNVHSHAAFVAKRSGVKTIYVTTNTFTRRISRTNAAIVVKDFVNREHWPFTRQRIPMNRPTNAQFAVKNSIIVPISKRTCNVTPRYHQLPIQMKRSNCRPHQY